MQISNNFSLKTPSHKHSPSRKPLLKSNGDSFTLSFNGYNGITNPERLEGTKNKQKWCVNYTFMFRDAESLDFAVDYLAKKFPKGAPIADFACSDGEETYTIAMLLKKINEDKKFKITGYDISGQALKEAREGVYEINKNKHEDFLTSDKQLSPKETSRRDLFYDCFHTNPENDFFCPKQEIFENVISFKQGDISNLNKLLNGQKQSAIVFKNAWYHITYFFSPEDPEKVDLTTIDDILKQAHKALLKDGLLVIGILPSDHLLSNQPGRTIIQDGKEIQVCDNTPFHRLLRKNGFEPVYYEQNKSITADPHKYYLPSVWRKVPKFSMLSFLK